MNNGMGRLAGVTVLPEYAQVEGPEAVLDRLQRRAGITAVSTSPYVMEPSAGGQGAREPPDDAGQGLVRLLDRPLWDGRRELIVRTAPSFVPNKCLYDGLRYQPPEPTALTEHEGPGVGRFIGEAKRRGLKVYLQVQAAIPPGYRVQFGGPVAEDEPRLPDDRKATGRVDRNGCLASPHIRAYAAAMIADLLAAYPDIDGFRIDWPEYPAYSLDSLFLDFSPHAMAAASRLGFDVKRMRHDALALYGLIKGGLDDATLSMLAAPAQGAYAALRLVTRFPGFLDLLRLKALLSAELAAVYRTALDAAGGKDKELWSLVFAPPFSLFSGFDYGLSGRHCDEIGVKIYTMHWPMVLSSYGRDLLAANARLTEAVVVRALAGLLGFADGSPHTTLHDYRYPEPDEPHPIAPDAQRRKIETARQESAHARVHALVHGYGPAEDFALRLRVAWEASEGRIWLNRYGYLADAKLDAIGAIQRG